MRILADLDRRFLGSQPHFCDAVRQFVAAPLTFNPAFSQEYLNHLRRCGKHKRSDPPIAPKALQDLPLAVVRSHFLALG